MTTMLVLATLLVGVSLIDVVIAGFLWTRQRSGAAVALALMSLSTAVWCLSYGASLIVTDRSWWMWWGDVQYVGVVMLVPAWVVFTLLWTRRSQWVNGWTVALLCAHPVVVLFLLYYPATHDLIRYPPEDWSLQARPWVARNGAVFWIHFGYVLVSMVISGALFMVDLWRRSQVYRRQVIVLSFAAVFPLSVNIAYNVGDWPFDLTPLAFSVGVAILTWGVLRHGLLRLAPIAHSQVVAGLTDAVLVLDVFGNIVESNPAAATLLRQLPGGTGSLRKQLPAPLDQVAARPGEGEIALQLTDGRRVVETQVRDLPDSAGHAGGRLIVLRDITTRRREERQRTLILADQARVAETLSRSLRPDILPVTSSVVFAAEFRPAGAGREIGGDFYDVYRSGDCWAFTIGDVSGKGATAAAVTALSRYSLRALSTSRRLNPRLTVQALNRQLLSGEDQEKYLTVAHGWCRGKNGQVGVQFVLGGHPQPLVVPVRGDIAPRGLPGTAIGLIDDIELRTDRVTLAPGDALVFYTDGVTEGRQGSRFFGEEQLVRELDAVRGVDAAHMARHVLEAALAFQRQDPVDDMAILVLQAPLPAVSDTSRGTAADGELGPEF